MFELIHVYETKTKPMKTLFTTLFITLAVLLGHSQTFTPVSTNILNLSFSSFDWADYDNDGDSDLAIMGHNSNGCFTEIYRNDGNFVFTDINAGLTGIDNQSRDAIKWGDYDNDGFPDLLMCGNTTGGTNSFTKIFHNNQNGTFTDLNARLPANNSGERFGGSLAWADFNNDGYLDFVLKGYSSPCNYFTNVYRNNNGTGTFTSVATLFGTDNGALDVGDFNNDGRIDIITNGFNYCATSNGSTIIYRNDSAFNFTSAFTLQDALSGDVHFADINNDGFKDVMVSGRNANNPVVAVYQNNSGTSFTLDTVPMPALSGSAFSFGDYNNDGTNDLFYQGATTILLWNNTGNSTFIPETSNSIIPLTSGSCLWIDINGDGRLDLITSGDSAGVTTMTRIYNNVPSVVDSTPTVCDTLLFGAAGVNDWAGKCIKTNDGNIVVVGTLNFGPGSFTGGDIFLRKYDSSFNQIWSQVFYAGGGTDIANSVIATSDGGYLINNSFGDSNPAGMYSAGYIIKTDSLGNQEWVHTLIGQSYGDNYSSTAIENSIGEFICYGQVQHHNGCPTGYSNGYSTRITKLSSSGTELWSYCLNLNPDWDGGIDKLQNSDNYISIYNDATTGNSEIRKWDDNGGQTGIVTYKFASQFNTSSIVRRCKTGGFFLFGQYDSTGGQKNAFISKFDDNMNVIWEKFFNYSADNKFNEVTEDIYSNIYAVGNINPTTTEQNAIALKLDSSGNFLSDMSFGHLLFGSANGTVNALGICVSNSGDVFCSGSVKDGAFYNALIFKICNFNSNCNLSFNSQPINQYIVPGNNAQFIVSVSGNNITYQWQNDTGLGFQNINNAGQCSGANDDSLIVSNISGLNNNENFRCIITSGSCSDTSIVAQLTINTTGIAETVDENGFVIYPNPVSDFITLKVNNTFFNKNYSIIDQLGRTVISGKINSESSTINMSELARGIYHFRIGNGNKKSVNLIKR